MNRKISRISACLTALIITSSAFASVGYINANAEGTSYKTEFNVNLSGEKKEISPYIYGINYDTNEPSSLKKVTTTVARQGGNRFTGYNWETNYSNAGEDWKNSSDTHLSTSTTPGACAIKLSDYCNKNDIGYKFTTLQMAGYVAADTNGSVSESEVAPSSRWNKVENRKNGVLSLTPDLTDDTVYMDEYVNYLVKTLGDSTTSTGIQGYSLDNEPALWNNTHPYLHPNGTSIQEIVDKSTDLAKVVKEIDPNADVFGPALWGYLAYKSFDSQDLGDTEWNTIKAQGDYNWFVDYYLDEMKKASDEAGTRLIDYLDVHYYAQDTTTQEGILQGVRTLYDENYVENSWIGEMKQWFPSDLPILPNLQNAIDKYYPDTKLSISEYDFYGGNDITGAIVEAEALGCFADNGVGMATFWDCENGSPYTYSAINLFTNYDGNGSNFGDTLLETSIEDNSKSNAYASIDGTDDSQVNIVITNKDTQNDEVATVNLQNSSTDYKSAVVYGIVDGSSDIVVLDKLSKDDINNNSFDVDLQSLSVVHVVVSNDANAFDNIDISTPVEPPKYTEVTYNVADYLDEKGNIVLNVDNPNDIAKISIEANASSTQGSSWWSYGGGICVNLEGGTWAFKNYMFTNASNTIDVEFDGSFTDANQETIEGKIADNKLEFQHWWASTEKAEKGEDLNVTYKTITIYYKEKSEPVDPIEPSTTVGDINNDNKVDYLDLLLLKKHILGVSSLSTSSADVNGDNSINVVDVTALKNILLKNK